MQNLNPVCWLVWLSYPTTAPLKLRSSVRTEQMHACRLLRPLLPNRANEVSNKETTIRLQCLTHICAQYTTQAAPQNFAVGLIQQLEKMFSFQSGPKLMMSSEHGFVRRHAPSTPSTYRVFKGLAKLIKKGSPSPRSNGHRLTSKSALADFEVGEVRQVRLQSLETVEQMQWPTWLIWGIFICSTVSKISSTSEAVKQSQRRPIHSAPVSALTGENVFRSKDKEAKVVPCFLHLLCHEIKTLFTARASETFSIAWTTKSGASCPFLPEEARLEPASPCPHVPPQWLFSKAARWSSSVPVRQVSRWPAWLFFLSGAGMPSKPAACFGRPFRRISSMIVLKNMENTKVARFHWRFRCLRFLQFLWHNLALLPLLALPPLICAPHHTVSFEEQDATPYPSNAKKQSVSKGRPSPPRAWLAGHWGFRSISKVNKKQKALESKWPRTHFWSTHELWSQCFAEWSRWFPPNSGTFLLLVIVLEERFEIASISKTFNHRKKKRGWYRGNPIPGFARITWKQPLRKIGEIPYITKGLETCLGARFSHGIQVPLGGPRGSNVARLRRILQMQASRQGRLVFGVWGCV